MNPQHQTRWSLRSPEQTHFAAATCAEVECSAYLNGWITRIDETSQQVFDDDGNEVPLATRQAQAAYIRRHRKGEFTETRQENNVTAFKFGPGHRCFASSTHKRRLERDVFYQIQGGAGRVNVGADEWVERFAISTENIAKLKEEAN